MSSTWQRLERARKQEGLYGTTTITAFILGIVLALLGSYLKDSSNHGTAYAGTIVLTSGIMLTFLVAIFWFFFNDKVPRYTKTFTERVMPEFLKIVYPAQTLEAIPVVQEYALRKSNLFPLGRKVWASNAMLLTWAQRKMLLANVDVYNPPSTDSSSVQNGDNKSVTSWRTPYVFLRIEQQNAVWEPLAVLPTDFQPQGIVSKLSQQPLHHFASEFSPLKGAAGYTISVYSENQQQAKQTLSPGFIQLLQNLTEKEKCTTLFLLRRKNHIHRSAKRTYLFLYTFVHRTTNGKRANPTYL